MGYGLRGRAGNLSGRLLDSGPTSGIYRRWRWNVYDGFYLAGALNTLSHIGGWVCVGRILQEALDAQYSVGAYPFCTHLHPV